MYAHEFNPFDMLPRVDVGFLFIGSFSYLQAYLVFIILIHDVVA